MTTEEKTMAVSRPVSLIIIAVVTKSNGLGTNGQLPWRLPKEMAHFRKATNATGRNGENASAINAVIMGRKTWESIPAKFRPLKGRINVVVSRLAGKEAEERLGVKESHQSYLVSSLDSAVDLLQKSDKLARTFLIGGAQLYSQAMQATPKNAILDRLLITRIYDPAFEECDVFLPEFRADGQIKEEADGKQLGTDDSSRSEWKYCKEGELADFIGEDVESDIIEEEGVRYQLQMWERCS